MVKCIMKQKIEEGKWVENAVEGTAILDRVVSLGFNEPRFRLRVQGVEGISTMRIFGSRATSVNGKDTEKVLRLREFLHIKERQRGLRMANETGRERDREDPMSWEPRKSSRERGVISCVKSFWCAK